MGLTAAIGSVLLASGSGAVLGGATAQKPDMPAPPPDTDQSDAANQDEATKAAAKRRRLYAGLGRSSTILTRGMNLGGVGGEDSGPKMLLGI